MSLSRTISCRLRSVCQGDDCTRAHDVVIDVCKLPWQSASVGLGAGYVAWTVKDAASCHSFLGFSMLGKNPGAFEDGEAEGLMSRWTIIKRAFEEGVSLF